MLCCQHRTGHQNSLLRCGCLAHAGQCWCLQVWINTTSLHCNTAACFFGNIQTAQHWLGQQIYHTARRFSQQEVSYSTQSSWRQFQRKLMCLPYSTCAAGPVVKGSATYLRSLLKCESQNSLSSGLIFMFSACRTRSSDVMPLPSPQMSTFQQQSCPTTPAMTIHYSTMNARHPTLTCPRYYLGAVG